jgi:prolyl oligopeptidase
MANVYHEKLRYALAMRTSNIVVAALAPLLLFADYPVAPKRPVVDTYGAVKVTDDYRWLENAGDPEVQKWVAEENRITRAALDAVPGRAEIARRLDAILRAPRLAYFGVTSRGGKIFAMKAQPPKEQPFLVVFDSPSDPNSERVVFDPNTADAKGSTSIDFYVPSLDAHRVAVSLSQHGSEEGAAHILDTTTGADLGDIVPRVNSATAGGSVAWNGDASGFWYTRHPQGDEHAPADAGFYQQIWFHKIGTAASEDTYVLGRDFPRIAETELQTSDDGRGVLASVKNGDGGEVEHFLRRPDGQWTQLTHFADKIRDASFGADGSLYMLSHAGASNGKLLQVSMDRPSLANAKVIVDTTKKLPPPLPDGLKPSAKSATVPKEMSIDNFVAGRNLVYVAMMAGGPSELLTYDRSGNQVGRVPIPAISSVVELVRVGGDDVLLRDASYTTPATWFHYDAATKKMLPAALRTVSSADFSDAVVVREFATSKDGTPVPVNIVYRKGLKRDGSHPTILYGYGGYSISERPEMSLASRVWLDAGGIVAYANIRGGGEYGEAWHESGKMLTKQNVFDDFTACAEHMIARNYTTSAKLAIRGGSNGGLLMGAVMTQHPHLMRAVVSHVGLYDMPRFLRTPNGVFNTTEYGSPDNPQQLRSMLAYSPYHHVVDGTAYPAALFLTGDNDGRVDPMNSRKFVARLQAATSSPRPILLRTTSSSGHGIGTALSEAIASTTDYYSFLWKELDVKPLQ